MPAVLVGDLNFSVGSGNRTDRRLSVFQADVQFLVAFNFLNSLELDRDISCSFGMQHERLAIRFHDCAGQAIPVFQT